MIAGQITHIAEVGMRVADLQKMIAFYRDVLGFEVESVYSNHAFLRVGKLDSPLGNAGHAIILGLFHRDRALDSHASTLDHLAFEIRPEYYDEALAQFQAQGMVIRERAYPETLDWRARSFFFYDPEGNVIELIAAN